jgi:tRNA threonylcarbamoyladenosine modification (KEOPS) complex  Pcc1 subunit
MRKISLFSGCVLALFVCGTLHAQFRTPTQEELQMKDDPRAPGAAAVYLDYSEFDDDPLHHQIVTVRIKVLQEKGKELATVEVPYEKRFSSIADVRGRTIHADGTIIPLNVKPEDLMTFREGEKQYGKRVFTLPSVEVGSILEYTVTYQYDDYDAPPPTWEMQGDYYVHKAHYSYRPYPTYQPGANLSTASFRRRFDGNGDLTSNLIWVTILPKGASVKADASGRYLLDIADVPALPNEDNMPPLDVYRYRVEFYYSSSRRTQDFWPLIEKHWSREVDHFADPSKAIHEAVNGLIAPGDSDLDKAKKIYKAVAALENTDYTRSRSAAERKQLKIRTPRRAGDIWAQKSGDSEEIALLYLAMARAAGLHVAAAKVADRQKRTFDLAFLSARQMEDTVILLTIDGKLYPLDPGEKMCSFGQLSWRHASAGGMMQKTSGDPVIGTPPTVYTDNKTTRVADLNLDAQGHIEGTINVIMTGQSALYWRQQALRIDPDELKKQYDQTLESMVPPGVEAHLDHFLGIDNPDASLVAVVQTRGQLGAVTARRLILPAFFFEARGTTPFVKQEVRQTSVDMHYAEAVSDEVTLHLPAGVSIEGAPVNRKEIWKDHAYLSVVARSEAGQIVLSRALGHSFTFVSPEEYQDLRAFYQKVAASDQQQLVLKTESN